MDSDRSKLILRASRAGRDLSSPRIGVSKQARRRASSDQKAQLDVTA